MTALPSQLRLQGLGGEKKGRPWCFLLLSDTSAHTLTKTHVGRERGEKQEEEEEVEWSRGGGGGSLGAKQQSFTPWWDWIRCREKRPTIVLLTDTDWDQLFTPEAGCLLYFCNEKMESVYRPPLNCRTQTVGEQWQNMLASLAFFFQRVLSCEPHIHFDPSWCCLKEYTMFQLGALNIARRDLLCWCCFIAIPPFCVKFKLHPILSYSCKAEKEAPFPMSDLVYLKNRC